MRGTNAALSSFESYYLTVFVGMMNMRFWSPVVAAKAAKIRTGGSITFTAGECLPESTESHGQRFDGVARGGQEATERIQRDHGYNFRDDRPTHAWACGGYGTSES